MSAAPPPHPVYFVTDETLRRFAESTTLQRLQWLEEMRTFSWNAATDRTRALWRAERDRRRGLDEVDDASVHARKKP